MIGDIHEPEPEWNARLVSVFRGCSSWRRGDGTAARRARAWPVCALLVVAVGMWVVSGCQSSARRGSSGEAARQLPSQSAAADAPTAKAPPSPSSQPDHEPSSRGVAPPAKFEATVPSEEGPVHAKVTLTPGEGESQRAHVETNEGSMEATVAPDARMPASFFGLTIPPGARYVSGGQMTDTKATSPMLSALGSIRGALYEVLSPLETVKAFYQKTYGADLSPPVATGSAGERRVLWTVEGHGGEKFIFLQEANNGSVTQIMVGELNQ